MKRAVAIILCIMLFLSIQSVMPLSAVAVTAPPIDGQVLYENDFSNGLPGDLRIVQGDSSKVYIEDGFLHMDGQHSALLRVLLPEYLDQYGDYEINVRATISEPASDGRWGSVVFRAQSGNSLHYPYYQMCVRENTTAVSGVELAERTPSDAWNVKIRASYIKNISPDALYTFKVRAVGDLFVESINGVEVIRTTQDTGYLTGGIGLQVSYCKMKIDSIKVTYAVGDGNRLAFFSDSPFTLNTAKNWDGTLQYSTNLTNWSTWNGSTVSSSASGRLYLRGTNNTVISTDAQNGKWVLTGADGIECSGNIENLLDYATVAGGGHPAMDNNCFQSMFYSCSSLTSAPDLPATALSDNCYFAMFLNCTSLTSAPDLPAMSLTNNCYYRMFKGCSALTFPPELPATALADACYYSMFEGCVNLTSPAMLPVTALKDSCYSYMFKGCVNLTSLPELPATVMTKNCYWSMFEGCIGIRVSTVRTSEADMAWRLPSAGTGTTDQTNWSYRMLTGTGGTFAGAPTINTTYYVTPCIYSVDIVWGGMNFDYCGNEAWNTSTHRWESVNPEWRVNDYSNYISVSNNSNVGVEATFSFTNNSEYNNISGFFTSASDVFADDKLSIPKPTANMQGDEHIVRFVLSGELPESAEFYTAVGTITVTLDRLKNVPPPEDPSGPI